MVRLYGLTAVDKHLSEVAIFKYQMHPGIPKFKLPIEVAQIIRSKFKLHHDFKPLPDFNYEVSPKVLLNKYKFETIVFVNDLLDYFEEPVIVEHKFDLDVDMVMATVNFYRNGSELIVYEPVFIEGFRIFSV
jgi:hypothetical protein